MLALTQDLKYGLRMLAKSPGFTAVAVLTLALGIGANTVMFSSINAMLLRPFAFRDLDRAVDVWETAPKQNERHMAAAPANFRDWQEQAKGIELLAAARGWDVNLTGKDLAERLECSQVTANFFPLLGIPAQLGRYVVADSFGAGHNNVVVLSHGFWQRHFGADSSIVGQSVLLSGEQFRVIGVMPSDFDFPVGAEAWVPLDFTVKEASDRADHSLHVIGRLRAGVSMAKAQDDLETVAARLGREYPQTNAGHGVRVMGLVDDATFGTKQFVGVLMGGAGFVLLLACANVANLLLARVTGRQKEIAVRLALGAGRWQIVRQLIIESTLVSALGGLAGLLLAGWDLDLTRNTLPPFILQHIPGLKYLQADWRVLVFTMVVALLAGILTAVAPALHVSRPDLNEVLKEGARGGAASPSRHGGNGRSRLHGRKRLKPLDQLLVESSDALRVGVLRLGQRDAEGEHVAAVESQLLIRQIAKTPDHQPGRDQQDQGQGDLGDDQQGTEAVPGGAGSSAARTFLQHLVQVRPRNVQGGCNRGQNPGQESHHHREHKHPPISLQVLQPWDVLENERRKSVPSEVEIPAGEQQPRQAPQCGDQCALDDQLPHYLPAAGAEREAHCDLLLAPGDARQKQVGDVGTGEQKHKPGPAH